MPADVQIRCISLTTKGKARRREGDAAGEGKRFRRSIFFYLSSKTKKAEDGLRCVLSEGNTLFRPRWYDLGPSPRSARRPLGIAAFVACPLYLGPGKRWQQHKERGPCSCCARPLSSRFGIYYKRENPLQITTPLLGSVWNSRERTFLDI